MENTEQNTISIKTIPARFTRAALKESLLPSLTMKRSAWPFAVAFAYIATIYLLGGLRSDHIIITSMVVLHAYNERSRTFLKYFFPFILTGVVYDSMRYYYWWGIEGNVRVAEPYFYEKQLFGITENGVRLTPNEYFDIHRWTIADIMCGFAYLTFVAEYLATGFLLFFSNRLQLLRTFGWCFFLVNVMGFITYYIYPAAPPWYVTKYGLGPALMDVQASAAGAVRFDQFFGTSFFSEMYGRSVDIYGAIPSLHVSYPFLVAWVAIVSKRFRIPAIGFYLLMCFSAVYLQHHYIIDITLGTIYAIVALVIVKAVLKPKLT